MTSLANKGDNVCYYEASLLTKYLKEIIGGNAISISIFSINQGDSKGSIATLRLMSLMRRVLNYPVLMEGNICGLFKKFRNDL